MMQRPVLARSIIAFIITAFLAIAFANTADARRFGGGSNLGNQGQSNQQATPQRQGQQSERAGNRTAGMGMGGLLAGMAAGGLLAWMFMGGAFEGFQFFDFLIIGLLAFGIYMLIRHFRQNQALAQRSVGGASSQTTRDNVIPMEQNRQQHSGFNTTQARPGSLLDSFNFSGQQNYQPPSWFEPERFLRAAKGHFHHLQKAWDDNEMTDIFDYVTPEMYQELLRVRSDLGSHNKTEVISLNAELEELGEQDNNIIAQVRFTGQIREEGMLNRFDETWVVQRDLHNPDANWLIAGIRQN